MPTNGKVSPGMETNCHWWRFCVGVYFTLANMTMPTAHHLSLRIATEADVPFLLEIWQSAMTPHFVSSGLSPAEENPLHRLLTRYECAAIVSIERVPVGLLKVARDEQEWKLIQILLSPSVQGKGIGARLIQDLIAQAKAAGASLGLSVLKSNPARNLYLRLGFHIVSEEQHAYEMRYVG